MAPLPQTDRPLVGRADELALLRARTFGSAQAATTLLGGDAGVGKTRLLTALMHDAVDSGARVLLGHCLDLGDSSAPYLPFAEMFARLAQDEQALATRLVAERPLLAPLLPEYYRREIPEGLPTDRGSFFDAVHMTFEQLAHEKPLVLVVEDAHWADRSTRELLTFLFTRGFTSPVGLVVSYRSDDLHRRHPLRPTLAEWSRLPLIRRIALDGLSDAEMEQLVQLIRPEAAAGDTTAIVARAGGNPFFAEELLAACRTDTGIPDELADLLLVRIDALDDAARATVRAASVSGRTIDHELLTRVVDLDTAALDAALRTLVDIHIFETTGNAGYAFRHALLGEAVYDDLLPGERVALHGRFAEALREQTGPGPAAALARHARVAGKHELALEASIRAGDAAMAAHGPADAALHYENALAQLAERPDAGIDHLTIALRACESLVAAGDPQRGAQIAATALTRTGGDDEQRGLLVAQLITAQLMGGNPPAADLLHGEIDARAGRPPTPASAKLYAALARVLFFLDDFDGSLLAANQATVLARDLDLPAVATDALTTLARLDEFLGDPADAEQRLRELVDEARANGHTREEMRALHQLGRVQSGRARYAEAYRTHREALERGRTTGLVTDPFNIDSRTLGALYGLMVGDAEGVDELLEPDEQHLPGLTDASLATVRLVRDFRRGRPDVLDDLPPLRALWRRDMFVCVHTSAVAIDALGHDQRLDDMLAAYDEAVGCVADVWSLPLFDGRIRLAALAIGHLADTAEPPHKARVDALSADVEAVAQTRPSEQMLGPESRAWLLRARAEHARYTWGGRGMPPVGLLDTWQTLVATFSALGEPYETARVQLTHAALLSAAGERDTARRLLDEVRGTARRIGAGGLIAESRRSTPGTPGTTLTPREQEVLSLVSDGRTNGDIAKALFISTKTASVHVSNILAKLGAATRTEAAAIARRDDLL